jgi:hypothetical protein
MWISGTNKVIIIIIIIIINLIYVCIFFGSSRDRMGQYGLD